jgi:hypothetical protein
MADLFADVGRSLDTLLARLGIRGVQGSDAAFYILGLLVFLMFCAGVHSAIRVAFLRCSPRR